MILPSTQVFHGLRPPIAVLTATSSSSSAPTIMASRRASLGFWDSVQGNYCHLKCGFGSRSNLIRTRAVGNHGEGENHDQTQVNGSMDTQVVDLHNKIPERDFTGTPYVLVYVMLPLGVINLNCELVDPEALINELKILKSLGVDGVRVDCWWGIVEERCPCVYNWDGYRRLFQIVHDINLKLKVVMSFHGCGDNVGDDVNIPLPSWVREIGENDPDIYFTDREGRRDTKCLSWGIDHERVLEGRTAWEVYYDNMRSFRNEFNDFLDDGIISEVEVGLGPCGELRYPSYPAKHGWKYPGIGEFQCYDKYLMKSLTKAAKVRGHLIWARGPDDAGTYNSMPNETGFFRDGGEYDSYYGRFFLNWYSKTLVDHGDCILTLAKFAFKGTSITAKLSGIHWWYKTASHAAELTAGFYNIANRNGYDPIAAMLKKNKATLNFTHAELRTLHEHFPEALVDPEGLAWQVLNSAWDAGISVASENAFPCYDSDGYSKIAENAKPFDDPDGRHLSTFTYHRLSPTLMEPHNLAEFECFVKKMHGGAIPDLQGNHTKGMGAKSFNDGDGRHLYAFKYCRLSPTLMEKHNLAEFEHFIKKMRGEAVPD